MNREIEINKFNRSITFQNRGISFSQIGVANEILNLIDDLQQENKQLKEDKKKVIEYVNNIMYETKREEKIQDDLLEILGEENE